MKTYLHGADKIAQRICGMKTLSIAADGNRDPAILKVKYIKRSEIPANFNFDSLDIDQRATYEYILNKGDGYIGEEINVENISVQELKETIRNMTRLVEDMERKQDQKLKRYQFLINTSVKICNSYEEVETIDEEELYNLHQSLQLNRVNIVPKETDEQLIERLKNERVTLYRRQSDIPAGRQHDKSRELLRAINRVNKNNSNRRKKGAIQETNATELTPVSQAVNTPGFIMEILSPEQIPVNQIIDSPGFIMEILLPEQTQVVNTPELIIEILPLECNLITNQDTSSNLINLNQYNDSEQSTTYSENIPEDIEADIDPLKAITWPEYYHATKFVQSHEVKRLTILTGRPILDNIFMKLHNASMNNRKSEVILISNREEYLVNEMRTKYGACKMKDPVVKYMENINDDNFIEMIVPKQYDGAIYAY